MTRTNTRLMTTGILVQGSIGVLMCSVEASPQAVPETIFIEGTIRDFRKEHPDCSKNATVDFGPVAGNIDLILAESGKPTFTERGYRVPTAWRDRESRYIAPHLYTERRSDRIEVVMTPLVRNQPTIDSFNSTDGPYGGSNTGPAPGFQPDSTMPTIQIPNGLPTLVASVVYPATSESLLTEDVNCERFIIRNSHRLVVSGNVMVVVAEEFRVENAAQIQLADASSSLTVYVQNEIFIENGVLINTVLAKPQLLKLYILGEQSLTLGNGVHVYAEIVSPETSLNLVNDGQFYGRFTGFRVNLENTGGFHFDSAIATDTCGVEINDIPGRAGEASSAGVTSSDTFDQWYRDDLDVNLSMRHTLRLVRNLDGVYEYLDDEFYPVDDRLFGNQSRPHNYDFTFEATFSFIYNACREQFFELYGKDDIYLFIDNHLVIDSGGILHGRPQTIELDRLNLSDGRAYQVKLFYANRNVRLSKLNIRTNIELEAHQISPVASGGYD